MDPAGRSRGGAAPDETAPLLQSHPGPRYTDGVRPLGPALEGGDDGGGYDEEALTDEDDIDPNDFDLMLSKSASFTGGGVLEPESSEFSMLRGPRRYSIGNAKGRRRRRRRSAAASTGSGAATEDGLAPAGWDVEARGAGGGARAPSSPSTSDDDALADLDAPKPAAAAAAAAEDDNPYLGGVSVPRFWLIFAELMATHFIACFDGTIMASSHPVITSYFRSSNSASWLSTAFLLTSTAFQPLLGRLSDTVGRKTPYVATVAIFLAATFWCATAQSMASFIAARAVCGLGAGGMMTLGSIIISDLVPIEMRGNFQSYINVVYGVSAALGAALGGLMADALGWRWEFGVQVPPLAACLVVAVVAIPSDLGLYGRKRETFLEAMRAFDYKGSLLLSSAVTFLILGLNLGGNVLPWSHPFVIASLVIFGVCSPLFLYAETVADRPIMPLRLIRRAPHANLIFANHIGSILSNAIMFNIPLFFQAVLLTSATASGLRLVVPTVVGSVTGTATGLLITLTRRLKWPLVWGTAGFLAGTLCLAAFLRRGLPGWAYLLCMVPASAGQGFQFPGTFMAVLAVSDQADQAVTTSTLILWRSVGQVLGVAGSSLVVQNALVRYLARHVAGPDRDAVIARVRESVEAVRGLPPPYRDQVIRSYEDALRLTFLCCSGLALVSVLAIAPVKLPRLAARRR